MAPSPNWFAAILFYILFVAGLLVFVVLPGLAANALKTTLLRAAFFGLITYATYDLTNLATLKDWPALPSFVNMLWGTVLSVLVSYISFIGDRSRIGKGGISGHDGRQKLGWIVRLCHQSRQTQATGEVITSKSDQAADAKIGCFLFVAAHRAVALFDPPPMARSQ